MQTTINKRFIAFSISLFFVTGTVLAETPITTPGYTTKPDGTPVTGRVGGTDWNFRVDNQFGRNPGTGQQMMYRTYSAKDQTVGATGTLKYYSRYRERADGDKILRMKAERVMTEAEKTALKSSLGSVTSVRFKECGRPDGTRYTKVRVNYK